MGAYLNPGNMGFAEILNDDYIDKTGLISLINKRINKGNRRLVCISRPRRFGKSYTAQMLCAYYDHTCDSHSLFDGYEISKNNDYTIHMNQYQVIYLDMTNLLGKTKPENLIQFIEESIEEELLAFYPDIQKGKSFDQTLLNAVECSKKIVDAKEKKYKFIMIIDEWDAPIRETPEISEAYLNFLRMLFKSSGTTAKIFAAAYMTGILPIKKDGTESAVSDFDEFSVLEPGEFAPYTGFTEEEVKNICNSFHMNFEEAKVWYDGYSFGKIKSVYNPYSVMKAMNRKAYRSYWRKTSNAEALTTYVSIGTEEFQNKILRLLTGEQIKIYTEDFQNDVTTFTSDDDVFTLMVHLGYLAYDEVTSLVRIPNEEVRSEFKRLLQTKKNDKLMKLVRTSQKLFDDTLAENEEAVAKAIDAIHDSNYAPQYYNNEQSLRYIIKFAYIAVVDRYIKIEEMPSGKGIADVVFIPALGERLPAMIIELKWDEAENAAIEQIKNRHYTAALEKYVGDILLVGITYDGNKYHTCKIERISK